jgi:expansin (peptidoglycan-binding protein)
VLDTGRIQFGKVYPGIATYYAATGAGNCMFEAGGDLMVAAMNHTDYENSQACGAYVEVTGPKGTVTVKIVDQCPECQAGHIDLSQQAFARIADPVAGRVTISWRLLSPDVGGPIAYRFKEGSSQWWCGVQIRNHRNPVRSVEALVGGAWRQIPRQDYNYFVAAEGGGCGAQLRATDIYGNQVTSSGPVAVQPGVVQAGPAQFAGPR